MSGIARHAAQWAGLARDRRGVMLVEFALVLPVLVILLLGSYDYGRYVIVHQKVQRTSATIADLVARETQFDSGDVSGIMSAAGHVMSPFSLGSDGNVIITVMTDDGSGAEIVQQYSGGGSMVTTSRFGTLGATPTLPTGLTVDEDEVVVATEVFFWFDALFLPSWAIGDTIYDVSFFRPRGSASDFLG